MVVWLVGWLVTQPVNWLFSGLVGRLVGWSICRSIGGLVSLLVGRLVGQSVGWLVGRLIGWPPPPPRCHRASCCAAAATDAVLPPSWPPLLPSWLLLPRCSWDNFSACFFFFDQSYKGWCASDFSVTVVQIFRRLTFTYQKRL